MVDFVLAQSIFSSPNSSREKEIEMGKAFLSHSSKDKQLVEAVYALLGSRHAEYDKETFESGLPNWDVILRAFERCDLFVLFATSEGLSSNWVQSEIREAKRRIRDRRIKRLLIFIPDSSGLISLPANLRDFAVFLNLNRPAPIVAAIQRHLLELAALARRDADEFVGRDLELADLKSTLLNPELKLNGVSIAGFPLLGRAALIRRAMKDLYPVLHGSQRVVDFHVFESCADLAIDLHGSVNELISPDQIDEYRKYFVSDDAASCGRRLYEVLRSIGESRQYVIFSDRGGIINHRGSFTNIAASLVEAAASGDDLRVFFLTTRRPIMSARAKFSNLAFVDLQPMSERAAQQYVVQKARARKIKLNSSQVGRIVEAGHGHIQNLDIIIEKCCQYPPEQALDNLEDIYQIRSERSRLLLASMNLSDNARYFIALLNHYFNIPAEFVGSIFDDYEVGAEICAELLDNYAIIESHGIYTLSPPLVDAVSRDRRFILEPAKAKNIARKFADLLNGYREDGVVPVNIIDAASIASIESGEISSNWTNQFILPSHYIYLARHAYNRRQYQKSIEYCESAIAYRSSLTDAAYIYACRTLGMSAARVGDTGRVLKAVALLNGVMDPFARAAAAYVRGFDFRLSGRFDLSEQEYLRAQETMRDDVSLMRELALVSLLRRNYERAVAYGDGALATAVDSPYILDIVARSLIAMLRTSPLLEYDFKLTDILLRLKRACDENFYSFYHLRSAERNLQLGRLPEALAEANKAVRVSHDLAAPYLMRSRIHLAAGRIKNAREDRDAAKTRTQTAVGRHRYYDAEIIRVEIEIAIKGRRYREAVSLHQQLEQFGILDYSEIGNIIARAIDRDKTDLEAHLRIFARENRI